MAEVLPASGAFVIWFGGQNAREKGGEIGIDGGRGWDTVMALLSRV
jgi:hypothetical protein